MKIAVIGAGAMGSLFGGRLAESGNDIDLIDVSKAHVDAINESGLRLEAEDGDRRIGVRAGSAQDFEGSRELLIVFTKGMHTEQAVSAASHLIGPETWALTVQNGIGNVEFIAPYVSPDRIAVGMTNFPSDLKGPGRVASHGSGEVRIWSASGRTESFIEEISRTFNAAGLPCVADPAVEVAIWEKVAFNAALNSIAAATRLTVGAIGETDSGRELAGAIVAETLAVARSRGLTVDDKRVGNALDHAFSFHRGHQPSMLQDILAGRQTEIETINGAIVAAGRVNGVATPVTETLLRLVRLIETSAPA